MNSVRNRAAEKGIFSVAFAIRVETSFQNISARSTCLVSKSNVQKTVLLRLFPPPPKKVVPSV